MRMLRPRSLTSHVHSCMQLVSCNPVMRASLNSPYTAMCSAWVACNLMHASIIALIAFIPFIASVDSVLEPRIASVDSVLEPRITAVLKFVCPPDPFQVRNGLG